VAFNGSKFIQVLHIPWVLGTSSNGGKAAVGVIKNSTPVAEHADTDDCTKGESQFVASSVK